MNYKTSTTNNFICEYEVYFNIKNAHQYRKE